MSAQVLESGLLLPSPGNVVVKRDAALWAPHNRRMAALVMGVRDSVDWCRAGGAMDATVRPHLWDLGYPGKRK